ncbi:MAG: hypothetical protein RI949_390 [Pseudomonadota bacterium]
MLLLFNLDLESPLAAQVAAKLGCAIAPHEDRRFEDGEHKVRPLIDPRGAHAVVLACLAAQEGISPQDKLVRLLLFLAALRDHGARRVTAVLSYLAYARKDERTKPWDPVNLRVVSQLIESVGTDHVVALEVHNASAFDNAFRCPSERIDGFRIFDPWVIEGLQKAQPSCLWALASPDPGGVKRVLRWRESLMGATQLELGFAMVDKRRSAGQLSGGSLVAGDVRGRCVVLLDDLVASGGTSLLAARALRAAGAIRVVLAATHAVLTPEAHLHLAEPAIDHILFSDSISPMRWSTSNGWTQKVTVLSAAPLLAEAIARDLSH